MAWLRANPIPAAALAVVALAVVVLVGMRVTAFGDPCTRLDRLDARMAQMSTNDQVEHSEEFSDLLEQCIDSGGPVPFP